MPAKSYYLDNSLLGAVLKNTSYTSPVAVYAGLFTVNPSSPSDAGTEVTGGSYARQAVTWGAVSNGSVSNSAPVAFPTASAPWGTVVGVGIYDASSGGNLLYYGAVGTSKTVGTGDSVSFAATSLSVTEQ